MMWWLFPHLRVFLGKVRPFIPCLHFLYRFKVDANFTFYARISPKWPSKLRTAVTISPLQLHWVKGACMFRCNLPPAHVVEWPWSFSCHCDNTGVERALNKSQSTKSTLQKKFSRHSCQDLNLQPINHKSSALTNKLYWISKCIGLAAHSDKCPAACLCCMDRLFNIGHKNCMFMSPKEQDKRAHKEPLGEWTSRPDDVSDSHFH